jgi:uncharacterized protein (TIGR03067 family)
MLRLCGLLLAAGALLDVAADDKKDAAVKEELKKFEGTWVLVSGAEDGNEIADPEKAAKLVFKGDKVAVYSGDKKLAEGTLSLDPSAKPKAMDMAFSTEKGGKTVAIYELDGDTLKVCSNLKGEGRPGEFAKKGGYGLYVYKRDKK